MHEVTGLRALASIEIHTAGRVELRASCLAYLQPLESRPFLCISSLDTPPVLAALI